MTKLKCASFFAGVGGIDLGFEESGGFKTVYANEFDSYPSKTFELNFPDVKVDVRDIREVKSDEIPEFDVMLAGFPCQAFSIAGYRKGFDDEKGRGELFFELTRILGYKYTSQVLNAMHYGNVAQNRERIYIVAFRDKEDYDKFHWPLSIPLDSSVRDIIDFVSKVDDKYYYVKGKYKGDIYEKLVNAMKNDEKSNPAIYQWRRKYVRKNKSGVVPTLTANQGEGGHNVCLIHTDDNKIRKMTPRECFNAQGFPKDFKLPTNMSESRLYKQAGNSVCVSVIERIAENIKEVVE